MGSGQKGGFGVVPSNAISSRSPLLSASNRSFSVPTKHYLQSYRKRFGIHCGRGHPRTLSVRLATKACSFSPALPKWIFKSSYRGFSSQTPAWFRRFCLLQCRDWLKVTVVSNERGRKKREKSEEIQKGFVLLTYDHKVCIHLKCEAAQLGNRAAGQPLSQNNLLRIVDRSPWRGGPNDQGACRAHLLCPCPEAFRECAVPSSLDEVGNSLWQCGLSCHNDCTLERRHCEQSWSALTFHQSAQYDWIMSKIFSFSVSWELLMSSAIRNWIVLLRHSKDFIIHDVCLAVKKFLNGGNGFDLIGLNVSFELEIIHFLESQGLSTNRA